MQLDLFLDSRSVMLANDTVHALAVRDAERARAALGRLRAEAPAYPGIEALERLSVALAQWSLPDKEAGAIDRAVDWLAGRVAPAAAETLGEAADRFVSGFFRELADAARGLPYDPTHSRAHRAWLCLHCGAWEEAEEAADTILRAGANPDAIHWRALARHRRGGLDAALPDLFALAWRAPARFRSILAELADEPLLREWQRFDAASEWASVDETEQPSWFPAWYQMEHPAARTIIDDGVLPATPAAKAWRLLGSLLALEKRGHSQGLLSGRARLRELNRELFALYMENRTTRHL